MKIRTGVFLAFGMIAALSVGFLIYTISEDIRPRYLESVEEGMVDTGQLLAAMISQASRADALPSIERLDQIFKDVRTRRFQAQIYSLHKTHVDMNAYVTDAKGIVLYDSAHPENVGRDFYNEWRDVRLTLDGRYGARTTQRIPGDPLTAVLYVGTPIMKGDKIMGVLTVYKPADNANLFIKQAGWKLMTAGVLVGASLLLGCFLVSFWVSRPIERLTRFARAVRDGEEVPLPRLGFSREIRQMGKAFEQMRDALEGRQYVENYVQTLTHEIKSPLSSIQGAAELLQEPMDQAQRDRFAANIQAESKRIGNIVDKLMMLTSLESRKGVLESKPVKWSRLVEEVMVLARPLIDQKELIVKLSITKDLEVRGESFLLRQAMDNLLRNAIDFSPQRGTLFIYASKNQEHAEFRVDDQGPGIPPYALPRIYEKFFSLARPNTSHKSSGLGLSFVKEVADLHRGRITIGNRAEHGTTAVFSVPLA